MDEKENTRELVVVDVKRYKKVKKALAESEQRYRQLFEHVPIGIYRSTPDGRIVDANPVMIKMAGCASFAELAALNVNKEYSRASLKRSDFIKRLERDGEVKGLEMTWKTRDGNVIYVRENAKLVSNENGEVFFEGTVEDITQSKLAEASQEARTRQLEIINQIISLGNSCDSLEELLDSLLDQVLKPQDFRMAAIFMYDAVLKKMNVVAYRGVAKSFFHDNPYNAVESMPFSQVLQSGQPVFVDHCQEVIPDLARKHKWQMAGSIPMLSKGRVVGAINVACCNRAVFSPEEKSILELIGKEAGTLVSKLQAETALRESEKYYRALIDTSPEIIVVMDVDGNLQTVNQQFLKTGGYFYDEVIGASTFDFVAGLERLILEKKTATFIKRRKILGSEYLFKKKNGQAIPLEVSAAVLADAQGRPKGIIAIGRDISERQRAETALRESEEKFRSIAEQTGDLIAITDAAGVITYVSPSSRSFFRCEPEAMCNRNFTQFLDPPSIPKALASFQAALHDGKKTVDFELTLRRSDGSLFPGEVNGSSFHYREQYGSLVVIRDISQRKRDEEQLRFLGSITENTSEAIIVTGTDFRITYINKVAEKLFGYALDELKGRTPDLFNAGPMADEIQKELYRIVAAGKIYIGESLNKRKDGSTFYCEYKVMPLKDSDGSIYAYSSVQRDISERKEAEARLQAYQEQLRALTSEIMLVEERERRRIACELHDQIGQNLALCKLKVAALEKDPGCGALKDELAAVRRLLECSIQDARSLIFDLSPPVLYELGFSAALEWLSERLQEQFHIPVEFESRSRDLELQSDQQVILFQVVRELLMNVGKHSQAKQAKIILAYDQGLLKIQVNDDGVGFDATTIFAPRKQNSGFGLFSVRERLNYFNGTLEVKSRPGQGTQIVLTVPLPAQPAGRRPPVGPPGDGAMPEKEQS